MLESIWSILKYSTLANRGIISRTNSLSQILWSAIHFNLESSAHHATSWNVTVSAVSNTVLQTLSPSVHSEINTLHDGAPDLACITEIWWEHAAGPLAAPLSPAGHLMQAWQQGRRGSRQGVCVSFDPTDNHHRNDTPFELCILHMNFALR